MITQINCHRVQHGNIMNGIAELMGADKADIFYSDPPWGQGNLNYWQTINQRQTGTAPPEIEFNDFVNQIFDTAVQYCKGIILIEYGKAWSNAIIDKGCIRGLNYLGNGELLYKTGSKFRPLDLHAFSIDKALQLPPNYFQNCYHTYGMDTLKAAVTPFTAPGKIILDPCCGMGYTAQMALNTGMCFRGNEINISRLNKTIARLTKGK